MKVGVVRERAPSERRVALVPELVGKYQAAGLEVLVEAGAGAGAPIPEQRLMRRLARPSSSTEALYAPSATSC
jgi:NAD(P) transhydrogenase subunit alpha